MKATLRNLEFLEVAFTNFRTEQPPISSLALGYDRNRGPVGQQAPLSFQTPELPPGVSFCVHHCAVHL